MFKSKNIILIILITLLLLNCDQLLESNQSPICKITQPDNNARIRLGDTLKITVEAKDDDGNIELLIMYVDERIIDSTSSFPYSFSWNTNKETVGEHLLEVQAIDNNGAKKSDKVNITLLNNEPNANLVISPSSGDTKTHFTFDATGSSDLEDTTSELRVRWDWENDGIWDTEYSTDKKTTHQFNEPGEYTIKMEIKDSDGAINSTTSTISVVHYLYGPGIKINEIYSCGPPNKFFYFYDQYFELYNSSEDTLYLDGMIFCRMGTSIEDVTYIFQFPGEPKGKTQDYPILPDSLIVVAQDAFNHKDEIFNGEKSVDLSNADFEFRNSEDYGDYDNPDVPNLENLEEGHTLDFMVGVTKDVVLIADGSDINYNDGIDFESIIDCVKYTSSDTSETDIDPLLDAGFAGKGLIKYSGNSLERINPGYDFNNSTNDFIIIDNPTPGYQH